MMTVDEHFAANAVLLEKAMQKLSQYGCNRLEVTVEELRKWRSSDSKSLIIITEYKEGFESKIAVEMRNKIPGKVPNRQLDLE